LKDRELRKIPREDLSEYLIEKAQQSIRTIDLSEGAKYLDPDFGLKSAINWVRSKFGIELTVEELRDLEPSAIKDLVFEKALKAYQQKEIEFPVRAAFSHYTGRDATGRRVYDREGIIRWAKGRLGVELTEEDLRTKTGQDIWNLLVEASEKDYLKAEALRTEGEALLASLYEGLGDDPRVKCDRNHPKLGEFCRWVAEHLGLEMTPESVARMERRDLQWKFRDAFNDRYSPEMRQMERFLLLHTLDSAWKEHLLVMDHLRSSVSLRGYAQVDPKVEYKREGMRQFELMWESVGRRVTDLVFRMEQMDERFVGSMWKETAAERPEASPAVTATVATLGSQQQEAIENSQAGSKAKPIRKSGPEIGRNDPCPCGSGKKYKHCCMRNRRPA
ncbi:MAG TPA: SEC-C metal-binding domain-containing protein, partial [Thermogutta sp.]|nr:SEC-C metal-binding domain-containing protein [Thermogutta sp.]